MKKLIALLLAMVMVFGLVACGNANAPAATDAPKADAPATDAPKDDAPAEDAPAETEAAGLPYEGVELTIGLAPLKSADADKAFWDEQFKQFTAETGATVTVEVNDWGNLQPKYVTTFMSDDPYDVLYGWPGLLVEFVEAGKMIDLTPYYTEEEIAGEFFWNNCKYSDGGVYGVAFAGGAAYISLCANLDILNECGVEEVPDTWDELLDACAKIKEKRPDVYTYLTPMATTAFSTGSTISPFIWQAGGTEWNEDMTRLAIDTPEWHKAFEMLMTMVDAGYFSQDALGMERDVVDGLFADGKVAFTMTDAAQGKFPGKVDFKWVATTSMSDVTAKSYNAVDCLGVSSTCENKDAAVALIKFMNSPEIRDKFNKEVYVSGQLRATDIPVEFPEEMEDVFSHPERSYSPPMVAVPGTMEEVFLATLQQIVSGQVTIDEGLKSFQAEMDAALAE